MSLAAAAAMFSPLLAACSDKATADIHAITGEGVGEKIGAVRAYDGDAGLVLEIDIAGLAAGPHGFHLHENGSCEPALKEGEPMAGLAAGGHYDPQKTGVHEGPEGAGHLGDLPVLAVDAGPEGGAGGVSARLVAPRLRLADARGRALVIHEGGDNYSDAPKPLGGGGARIACGVVN